MASWKRYHNYTLSRGAYIETADDRINGWYIDRIDADTGDRRGPGYPSRKAAIEAIDALRSIADYERWA